MCGKKDLYNFLLVCKRFSNAKMTLFKELFQIHDLGIIDSHILLCGYDNLDYETNVRIISTMQNIMTNFASL